MWFAFLNGTPLQHSCLENPMDGGPWSAAVHGVAKSQTWLSDFTFTFHFHALEKETATHSSVLAWRIPGTGEPGGLPSMGSHRVGHDWSNLTAAAAEKIWKPEMVNWYLQCAKIKWPIIPYSGKLSIENKSKIQKFSEKLIVKKFTNSRYLLRKMAEMCKDIRLVKILVNL